MKRAKLRDAKGNVRMQYASPISTNQMYTIEQTVKTIYRYTLIVYMRKIRLCLFLFPAFRINTYIHPAMCKMDQEHDDNGVFVFVKWLIIAAGAVVAYVRLTSVATVHIALSLSCFS